MVCPACLQDFHDLLPRLLRPGGLYSFFNGLAPKNVFFHAVACQNVQLELQHLGFEACPVGLCCAPPPEP